MIRKFYAKKISGILRCAYHYSHTFESFKSMTNSFTIDVQALHKLESFSPFHVEVQYANNSYILSGPKIQNLP